MYRPTVRYDDLYREYVTNIFHSTHLDRNQIIRAALFIAGHTEQFSKIMEPYVKRGVSLPTPLWNEEDHELWLNTTTPCTAEKSIHINKPEIQKVQARPRRMEEQPTSRSKVFTPIGGIAMTVGNGDQRRQYSPRG